MYIKLVNICKSYGSKCNLINALDHINLEISQGEMTAIMGKSGCGKSTLINILGGLTPATDGEYYFCDGCIDTKNSKAMSKFRFEHVGYIVQNYALINNKTARQNIELPVLSLLPNKRQQEIKHYAQMLGIDDKLEHYPFELSGGENQRVAIARALIARPNLILADEPTGSLDTTNENMIMDILRQIVCAGTTVVIVTHDTNVANRCDRIIQMKDGRIIE